MVYLANRADDIIVAVLLLQQISIYLYAALPPLRAFHNQYNRTRWLCQWCIDLQQHVPEANRSGRCIKVRANSYDLATPEYSEWPQWFYSPYSQVSSPTGTTRPTTTRILIRRVPSRTPYSPITRPSPVVGTSTTITSPSKFRPSTGGRRRGGLAWLKELGCRRSSDSKAIGDNQRLTRAE